MVYEQPPSRMMPFDLGAKVQAIEEELRSKELINKLVQENLKEAQEKMKLYADNHKTNCEF